MDGPLGSDGAEHARPPRRATPWRAARRRLALVGPAVCLILIGAGAATLVAAPGSGGHAARATTVPLGTATVRRGNLAQIQRDRGRLSYPSRGSVRLGGSGTVTSLPHVGQILTEGAPVAGVDDQPIGVLFGATPLYRTLGSASTTGAQLTVQSARADLLAAQAALAQVQSSNAGRVTAGAGARAGASTSAARAASLAQAQVAVAQARIRLLDAERALGRARVPQSGPDVALVAGNMTALGDLHGFTDSWNASLGHAVRRWQQQIGATPTGDIDPDDMIVVGGGTRVTGVQGQVGDVPSAVTLSLSSSTRLATFTLRNGAAAVPALGRRVRISTPDSSTSGRVTRVTTGRRSTIVQVSLRQSSAVARAGSSRVTMSITTSRRRDALLVPTQALLALASGGYALQLPDGRLLAIHTGVVRGGEIEVSGAGVHDGLRVVSVT